MPDIAVRRRRSGAELEAHLLDAAWAELEEKSWRGLRMDAVARRAGVSKASLYDRWPSRGLLVRAAMQRRADAIVLPEVTRGTLRENLLELLRLAADHLTGPGGEAMRGMVSDALVSKSSIAEDQLAFVDTVLDRARDAGELEQGPIPVIVRNAGIPMVVEHFLFRGAPPRDCELREIVDLIWVPSLRAAASADTKARAR